MDLIARRPDAHIWVIGDIMLDEYLIGDISRISPEAPIPVMRVRDSQLRLGGATNVAKQLATLGARTSLCGHIGDDATGDSVLTACAENGIDARAVARVTGVVTTRKVRVLGHGQQVVRLDWEDGRPCPPTVAAEMVDRLLQGPPPDCIVVSDYGKGFVSHETLRQVLSIGHELGVRVLVDPKHADLSVYRGSSIVKPNLSELSRASGRDLGSANDEEIAAAARELVAGLQLEAMVVTLGDRGMLVVTEHHTVQIRGHRRAVFDVTGAGDTAMAVLALGLAVGGDVAIAAALSNLAAGLAVEQVGAASVTRAELGEAVTGVRSGKVLGREGLAAQVESWKLRGLRIVFTNGCFDLLHVGHLALLREAAALGDVLVLAINSDASVRRLKGDDRPLMPEDERAALLAALDCVDAVTIFDEDTPLETLERVLPDVLVKGKDYAYHEVVGRELVEAAGGRVELVPILPDHSTSRMVERIRSQHATTPDGGKDREHTAHQAHDRRTAGDDRATSDRAGDGPTTIP
jgi:D-beta-D-heptose 7-phosphate kinase/D-beta-D-heptose 1-phosphate adenosyltransferase